MEVGRRGGGVYIFMELWPPALSIFKETKTLLIRKGGEKEETVLEKRFFHKGSQSVTRTLPSRYD